MHAATARVLARNIESDVSTLHFSDFSVECLRQGRHQRLAYAREFFPEAMYEDYLIEREYQTIPPVAENWSGFGAIPSEMEDLLLLLRLYRSGDLAFIALSIQKAGSPPVKQYPYRAISSLVGRSTRQFRFNEADIPRWEGVADCLKSSPSWQSKWFEVSRRFFLYGGGKEFNPNFESEIDRIIDYITALEAALVPESDFVGRRLRERAVRLLGLKGEPNDNTKRLLTEIYEIRSTLVHGSSLQSDQLSLLRNPDLWLKFEQLARDLIAAAVTTVPANDTARRSFLVGLYDVDDAARAERLREDFRAIKDKNIRHDLLATLR